MSKLLSVLLLNLLGFSYLIAQPSFTAKDTIPPYNYDFGFGVNMGAYQGWTDDKLANIAVGHPELDIEGVGINALRLSLPENFVEEWGYDIRKDVFEHYSRIGSKDNVVFVGFPKEEHRDITNYCPNGPSLVFDRLFEPIWDNGENGTPVNDENHYAIYIYNLVNMYKDHVRIWQIWNEPDFSFTYDAVREPGDPIGSWWDDNPQPCDYALQAPIFHYIRMLRISYEVIKSIDETAYVSVGGLGYPSFLDAIMRNTDNPDEGQVTEDYPLKGGAYFDVLSYHSYPHIDGSLRYWDNDIEGFAYNRHSDEAVKGVFTRKYDLEDVLFNYGYDGVTYPEKLWIITEANVPRKAFELLFGSDEAQKNFIIKSIVECQKEDIKQLYFYQLGEIKDEKDATHEYDLMGLYKNLNSRTVDEIQINDAGIALKTASDELKGKVYDAEQTQKLQLPETVNGGAFRDAAGDYTYVLWAKTYQDSTERTQQTITFPTSLGFSNFESKAWNYSDTKRSTFVHPQRVKLTGSPIFLEITDKMPHATATNQVFFSPNPFGDFLNIDFYLEAAGLVTMDIYDMNGRLISGLITPEVYPKGRHRNLLENIDLAAGVYFLKVQLGERISTRKIIKMK